MADHNLRSTVALLTAAGVLVGSLFVLGMRRNEPDRPVDSAPERVVNRIAGDAGALSTRTLSSTKFDVATVHPTQDKAEATADFLYDNKTNRLRARMIQVTDRWGEPAVRGFTGDKGYDSDTKMGPVNWEIVWTSASEYEWNYRHAKLYDENELFAEEYPSPARYFEKEAGAKITLSVSIPDTPYSVEIVNGRFAPYFFDSRKYVLWRLNSPEIAKAFHSMKSVSTSSQKVAFSVGGGDVATFLTVDFSKRKDSPGLKYYSEFHGL